MGQAAPEPPQVVYVKGPPPSQAIPALANFFWPGLGQLIQGRLLAALVWFLINTLAAGSIFFLVGYVLFPITYIWCIVDAARYRPPGS